MVYEACFGFWRRTSENSLKKGFVIKRRKGSHVQLEDNKGRRVTVPIHPGRVIGRGLLRKILRDAEISVEEYEKLRQGI
ncbi:MAG: type II toxin-antitoxin system HicA family toxin [Thermoproteota archaeon]|jgi:predicted RNA binding protein YcfA (HicA-like mRNA interferase family)